MNKTNILFLVFLSASLIETIELKSFEDNPYWHREILDPRGKYQLEWRVDWSKERVEFNVTVFTKGYVVLGLSRNENVENADIVIGGVALNGKPYFSDHHTIGNDTCLQDPRQDWVLHSAWESGTHTFISVSRPFDTCDQHDIPINDDAVYVVWGYGERDNMDNYNLENMGTYLTYLRDPDITPRSIHEAKLNITFGGGRNPNPVVERIGDARRWAVRTTFRIPPKRTTYWCNIHKFSPATPGKKHVIGFNTRINHEAVQNVHHVILFRCIVPPTLGTTASVFEPLFRAKTGQECYNMQEPMGPIPTQFCSSIKSGHAIGGKPSFLPEHIGLPIGETSPQEYYVLVSHYDNPDLRSDIISDMHMDVYYTSNLRANDGGVVTLGHRFPGAPSLLLPPGEVNHKFLGHCSSSCTRKMLPPQGIKLFGGLLHTHTAGRKIRVQHFRNGKELPWILNDDNFQFLYQPYRILRKETAVLPGDQLTVQCLYDTTLMNGTTIGGFGTDQEMCLSFVLYHSVLEEYPICQSEITSTEYMMRYLAGTRNVTWVEPLLEFVATEPRHLSGMALSSISDSPYVNWDGEHRAQLKQDHITHPQEMLCPNLEEAFSAGAQTGPPPPDYASFPVEAKEYIPPQKCFSQNVAR